MVKVRYYDLDVNNLNTVNLQVSNYGNISDIKNADANSLLNDYSVPNYISFDGSGIDLKRRKKKFYSVGDYVGFISKNVSDEKGNITCEFNITRKNTETLLDFKKGITLIFYENCCKEIYVIYRAADGNSIYEESIPVGKEVFTFVPSVAFASMNIICTKTVLSNQYIKIANIKFGAVKEWERIVNINALEEINVLSDDLPINSLDFTVIPDNGETFSVGNPVTVHSDAKYYGIYYIEDIERTSKYSYSVRALNVIDVLDKAKYIDWDMDLNLTTFANQLKSDTGITLEAGNYNYRIFGHIPIESWRVALCKFAFACRFMIDCSRKDRIFLKPIPTNVSSVITSSNKRIIGDSKFTKSKQISKARFKYPIGYTATSAYEDRGCVFFSADTLGIMNVYVDDPVASMRAQDTLGFFEILSYSGNWIKVQAKLTGDSHILYNRIIYTYQNEDLINPYADNTEEKDFSKLNLCGISFSDDGSSTLRLTDLKKQDILKYIQSKGTVKAKIRLQNENVGDLIKIETAYDGVITGIITSMNISFGYDDIADIEVLEWQNG